MTHQFTHASRTYLFVEVDSDAYNVCISVQPFENPLTYKGSIFSLQYEKKRIVNKCFYETLPQGDWRLIGIVKDIQDFEPLVEKVTVDLWKNYADPSHYMDRAFDTAKESFASLLRSEGLYLDNPFREPTSLETTRASWMDEAITDGVRETWKWQEYQSKVVGSMVLLVKDIPVNMQEPLETNRL